MELSIFLVPHRSIQSWLMGTENLNLWLGGWRHGLQTPKAQNCFRKLGASLFIKRVSNPNPFIIIMHAILSCLSTLEECMSFLQHYRRKTKKKRTTENKKEGKFFEGRQRIQLVEKGSPFHTSLWLECLMLAQTDQQSKPYHCQRKVLVVLIMEMKAHDLLIDTAYNETLKWKKITLSMFGQYKKNQNLNRQVQLTLYPRKKWKQMNKHSVFWLFSHEGRETDETDVTNSY